jgi:small nuclear ribonucleoprotein (snRNP)-like protein
MSNLPLNLLNNVINNENNLIEIQLSDKSKFNNYYLKGHLKGVDHYMNIIIHDCKKINKHEKTTLDLGNVLLKGDNILLIKHIKD